MRRVVLLAVALFLIPVPGTAQADEPLLTDPDGDVIMRTSGGQEAEPPADRYGAADLKSLRIEEHPEGLAMSLGVVDLSDPAGANFFDSVRYSIDFAFRGIPYAAVIERDYSLEGTLYYEGYVGMVYEEQWGPYVDWTARLDVAADPDAGVLSFLVPRDAVYDEDGASPQPGDKLQNITVRAAADRSAIIYLMGEEPLVGASFEDAMGVEAPGELAIVYGVRQDGDARLESREPMRMSNGGASTVVFEVLASNEGEERQSFRLEASDVPHRWEVSLPFERTVLEAGAREPFPILLTTPSGHAHGGVQRFLLSLTGERDPGDVGRIELGLRYTDIPQPAGHHSKLWLHSKTQWQSALDTTLITGETWDRQVYMNAAPPEDDPQDEGLPVAGWGYIFPGLESEVEWYVPLLPELGMGLDFQTASTGTLSVPIHYKYLAEGATLSAVLWYETPDQRGRVELARMAQAGPASFGPDETHVFESELQILPQADFVPFTPDASLWLEIRLDGTFAGVAPLGPHAVPTVEPGGWMDLPLKEYRDPVDTFYQAVRAFRFDAEFLERPVNPGRTLVFETSLRNLGQASEDVALNVTGVNSGWARILGESTFTLAAGQQRSVAVAVAAPEDAPDGALADLVLQAVSEDDPRKRAVIDLIAIVDTEGNHPDEAGKVGSLDKKLSKGKQSPGFEFVAVLAVLAAFVLAMPRRRR